METYIQNKGQYQTSVNGNIIDNTHWNMAYDGNELDLEAERNDEAIYMKLNNDDILKLLEVPAYHKTITQRLNDDLNSNNKMDVRPIIVEELEDMLSHTDKSNDSDSSKHSKSEHSKVSRKSKASRKSTKKNGLGRRSGPNRGKRSSSSSSTKRRTNSKSNKPKPEGPKPDYLQTIY
jgi:hypothetical protein